MNPELNIKLLSREINGESTDNEINPRSPNYSNRALLRLWSWIDRVESLSFQDIEEMEEDSVWMAKSILDAGAWQLLEMELDRMTNNADDDVSFSETLSCNIYDSSSRRATLASCGWAGKFDLDIVMAECETLGEFERSAALAVWHENVGDAVEALQRGAQEARHQLGKESNPSKSTLQYAETLDLIAMCIAGYGGKTASQMAVWRSACSSLLQRDDLSLAKAKKSGVAYLRALCEFLLNVGTSGSLGQVLDNAYLSLCDRVAFACRFLEEEKLKVFLQKCIERCQRQGNIEGLVITGLGKQTVTK
jgi:hypothetical protein